MITPEEGVKIGGLLVAAHVKTTPAEVAALAAAEEQAVSSVQLAANCLLLGEAGVASVVFGCTPDEVMDLARRVHDAHLPTPQREDEEYQDWLEAVGNAFWLGLVLDGVVARRAAEAR